VLLGEAAVGKSSIVTKFVTNDFQENKEPTIGAAFLTQKCRLEDKVIKFEIWDTAGQERFHSLAPMYYRNAAAAVVVYDITSASSLEKAKSWVKELQRQANPNIVIAFVGNKLDLVESSSSPAADDSSATIVPPAGDSDEAEEDEADDMTATPSQTGEGAAQKRQVSKEEASSYASEAGLLFFETSAKTGQAIVDVFTEIAAKIPLDQYAGAGGRAAGSRGASRSGNASATSSGRVQLDDAAQDKKDACAC